VVSIKLNNIVSKTALIDKIEEQSHLFPPEHISPAISELNKQSQPISRSIEQMKNRSKNTLPLSNVCNTRRWPPPSPTVTTSHTTHEEPPISPTPTNLSLTRFQSKIGD